MTAEVRLRPEAERDLADAAAWYEEQRQGLGRQFLEETQVLLSSISENPLAYSLSDSATSTVASIPVWDAIPLFYF